MTSKLTSLKAETESESSRLNSLLEDAHRRVLQKNASAPQRRENIELIFDWIQRSPLGKYLLVHQRLNGYWLKYLIRRGGGNPFDHPIERWLMERCPSVLATRERFYIFQDQLSLRLQEGIRIASVPCGLMDELLSLNAFRIFDYRFIGVDLDESALEAARAESDKLGLASHCEYLQEDAWQLSLKKIDILVSNGLNIYEPSQERVECLYQNFASALKPGGVLITSFLTPPPAPGIASSWRLGKFDPADLALMRLLFTDVLQVRWQCYRNAQETHEALTRVGFSNIEIIYDSGGRFPTVVARKN